MRFPTARQAPQLSIGGSRTGNRCVISRAATVSKSTMRKVKLGTSDLEVTYACLGTMVRSSATELQHSCAVNLGSPSFDAGSGVTRSHKGLILTQNSYNISYSLKTDFAV
jgi:hypothetical protein